VKWRAPESFTESIQEGEMTLSITALDASTEEELQQALAGLLAHAREEVLKRH
jgi:DNA-directed RNA polymerase specialized sigma24 family protein